MLAIGRSPQVVLEDRGPGRGVGRQHQDRPVEAAGPAQRGSTSHGALVAASTKTPVVVALHAVELGRAADCRAYASPRSCIWLRLWPSASISSRNSTHGRVAPGRLEELVQVALGLADPHVQHVDDRQRGELRAHLAGDRPGQEGLAAAGRAVEQQAAAQALAVQRPQLRVAQRRQERQLEPLLDVRPCRRRRRAGCRRLDIERSGPRRRRPARARRRCERGEPGRDRAVELLLVRRTSPPSAGLMSGIQTGGLRRRGAQRAWPSAPGCARRPAPVCRTDRQVGDRLGSAPGPDEQLRQVPPQRQVLRAGRRPRRSGCRSTDCSWQAIMLCPRSSRRDGTTAWPTTCSARLSGNVRLRASGRGGPSRSSTRRSSAGRWRGDPAVCSTAGGCGSRRAAAR